MDSKVMKSGFDKAPQRSLLHALGLTEEEIERPLVGIVSSYNEIVPGHMNLDKICEAVKMGVSMAGGRNTYSIPGYCGMRWDCDGA